MGLGSEESLLDEEARGASLMSPNPLRSACLWVRGNGHVQVDVSRREQQK